MKIPVSFLSVALVTLAIPSNKAEPEVITKSFDVRPGGKLVMKVDRGSIHVTSSPSEKVDVKVVREVRRASDSEAKSVLEQHKIEMSQSENVVRIEAENPQKGFSFRNPFNRLRVEYTIIVPSRFNVDLHTAGGNIEISDLEGIVEARTAGGDLRLGAITGPVKAHTSGGNITLKSSKGDAEVHTSGGDLKIGDVQGDLVAKTSGGNINLEKVKGKIDAQTSGGDVRVQEAYGPVSARTSGGNVSARLNEQPTADCALKTSGGNVDLTIPDKLAVAINARTSGGSIHSDFPGELSKDKTRLTAQLNGGGPEMVLQTSGGNVNIRKR